MDHQHWLKEAVNMAVENVRSGHGGPFAAIIVQNGEVIGRGVNEVTTKTTPPPMRKFRRSARHANVWRRAASPVRCCTPAANRVPCARRRSTGQGSKPSM